MSDVKSAESKLRVKFNDEFIKIQLQFGRFIGDGIELTTVATKTQYSNVIDVTKKCRELNPEVPTDMYVIEDTGMNGIVIWQNTDGNVFMSKPNKGLRKICGSLSDYIKKRIKNIK